MLNLRHLARVAAALSLAVVAIFAVAAAASAEAADGIPPIGKRCCRDLARRLHVSTDKVKVSESEAVVWPDAALGLPAPGMVYAQVVTPGWRLTLVVENQGGYLYCASARAFKYGGPLGIWQHSALYVEPVKNDPNLNGNLMQVSLIGTNPALVATEVEDCDPQADGSIIARRRTSRSGYELLYVAPGASSKPVSLAHAFYFGGAVVDPTGKQWAAFSRPRLGTTWTLAHGSVAGKSADQPDWEITPEGLPGRLLWQESGLMVELLSVGDRKPTWYELKLSAAAPEWRKAEGFRHPADMQFVLNKSETLVVQTKQVDGKPVTEVSRLWFTGDEKIVARIPGLDYKHAELSSVGGGLFVTGMQDDKPVAYTVDIHTGEVLLTVKGGRGEARLLYAPPRHAPVTLGVG